MRKKTGGEGAFRIVCGVPDVAVQRIAAARMKP
jgi:hypothetical protein